MIFKTAQYSVFLCIGAAGLAMAQPEPARQPAQGALLAAETLKRQVLDRKFDRLVEISGKGGSPIPRAWTVIAYDSLSPSSLAGFMVRGNRIEPPGEVNTFYPRTVPEGYFLLSRVTVDSSDAFQIADKEAGLARVGFDALDFRLRAREFSEDAVWTVRLMNSEEEVVGNVDLSASSGKVLRTVWYYRDAEAETMRVVDSALTGLMKPPVSPIEVPLSPPVVPVPAPVPDPRPVPVAPLTPGPRPVPEVPRQRTEPTAPVPAIPSEPTPIYPATQR